MTSGALGFCVLSWGTVGSLVVLDDMALYESILRMRPRYPRSFSSSLWASSRSCLNLLQSGCTSGMRFVRIHFLVVWTLPRSTIGARSRRCNKRRWSDGWRIIQKRGDVVEMALSDASSPPSDWAPRLPLAAPSCPHQYDDDRERPTLSHLLSVGALALHSPKGGHQNRARVGPLRQALLCYSRCAPSRFRGAAPRRAPFTGAREGSGNDSKTLKNAKNGL